MKLRIRCRRTLILVLVLSLVIGVFPGCSYADYAYKVNGNSYDVYLRAYIGIGSCSSWIGHYDLQINGKIRINNHVFTNPCFSYGSGDSLLIFDSAKTPGVYAGNRWRNCRMYTWHFTINGTGGLNRFLSYLASNVKSVSSSRYGYGSIECKFKSSCVFSSYRLRFVNCFSASAYWLYLMGNSTLTNIYKRAYAGGPSYLPKPLVKYYSSHFTRRK